MTTDRALARDIFRELIEIDTTDEHGDVTEAATAMARRLLSAGLPDDDVVSAGPHPKKHNLVARLRGDGTREPLLLLAHLDVVAAPADQWTVDPFTFLERDGHYYGRGTTDDKAMCALWVATMFRLRRENVNLKRDIILVLTADEEGGSHNGAKWLIEKRPALVKAEFGLNEGGYGRIRDGKRIANQIQASEKTPVFFELVAQGTAGHSSLPPSDSAIVRLSAAIQELSGFTFPIEPSEITSAFFARMGESAPPEKLVENPYYAGLLRNTAVVTRLNAGVGDNVVPQEATALVDCRLLPGADVEAVRTQLAAAIGDDRVLVRKKFGATPAPASPLREDLVSAVERISAEMWPGVPVMPVMSIGATDSAHFRRAGTPMYGVSGLFLDVNDTRAHGPDERVLVESFHDAQEFLFRLVSDLAR